MKLSEYLLVCLSEELSEASQEVGKCLRFTPHHRPPDMETTNAERLALELADVRAVIDILHDNGLDVQLLDNPKVKQRYKEKRQRTLDLMDISYILGSLDT